MILSYSVQGCFFFFSRGATKCFVCYFASCFFFHIVCRIFFLCLGEQGWCSGESARFPPMWPGFDSRTRRHMWVEFIVSSRPCSEGFSPDSPVFLPPQKPTLPNSNLIGNSRATGLSVARLLCPTLVKHR